MYMHGEGSQEPVKQSVLASVLHTQPLAFLTDTLEAFVFPDEFELSFPNRLPKSTINELFNVLQLLRVQDFCVMAAA